MKKMLAVFILLPFIFSCGDAADEARIDTILALTADTANGKTFYTANCSSCHATDGSGTSLGPNIKSENDARSVLQVVLEGVDSMPSYSDRGDQDLADLTAYAKSL